ncbi:MAG TPA: FG-GAP-like repeat-containing protein, partial [Polyangia bacterium]|nr:FG-GAP-like repeat-containing protein [Polyangia bacterium]
GGQPGGAAGAAGQGGFGHAGGAAGAGAIGGSAGSAGAGGPGGGGQAGAGAGGAGGHGTFPACQAASSTGGGHFGIGGAGDPIFTRFTIPTDGSSPGAIITGPDCNLWFVESQGNKIGRITPAGAITEFPIPTTGAAPSSIAVGPDGNLWFSESVAHKLGRITTAGLITEFTIPGGSVSPLSLTAGPDGRLWFTTGRAGVIGSLTTDGVFSSYPISSPSSYYMGITVGNDGALWFSGNTGLVQVDRMSISGEDTLYRSTSSLSSPWSDDSRPSKIVSGPDGNLWFSVTNNYMDYIAVVSTSGTLVNLFAIPYWSPASAPGIKNLTFGPDGNLYMTEADRGAVVRMTPTGTVTDVVGAVPAVARRFTGIAFGPDGNLWYTDVASNAVWRMQPPGSGATGAGGIGGGSGGMAGAGGAPAVTTAGPFTCGSTNLGTADFDGDGISDCVIATPSPSSPTILYPTFLKGSTNGFAQTGVVTAIPLPGTSTALSNLDLSGDGRADLTVTSSVTSPSSSLYVTYLKPQTDGSFTLGSQTRIDGNLNLPVAFSFDGAGDLNGDGKQDLLLAGWTEDDDVQAVSWLVISDKGSTALSAGFTLGGMGGLSLGKPFADFNGDGKLDVAIVLDQVTPNHTVVYEGVSIVYGNGDGTFQPPVQVPGSPTSSVSIVGVYFDPSFANPYLVVGIFPPFQTVSICGDRAGHFNVGCR